MNESREAVPSGPVRILGVDTALRCTGYGLIDTAGNRFEVVDCGVIRNKARLPLSACLRRLAGGIDEIVKEFQPDIAVVEGTFFARNAKTSMILGMARGSVVSVLAQADIVVYEYSPRRVKQAVCGHGNAGKHQVAMLISQLLSLRLEDVPDDATDALAIAVCHAQTMNTVQGLHLPDPL